MMMMMEGMVNQFYLEERKDQRLEKNVELEKEQRSRLYFLGGKMLIVREPVGMVVG